MNENTSSEEVPVALLSQALVDFRAARGNRPAEREAALRYFRGGLQSGYELGAWLQWLLFWPNDRESVFWQARLDVKFVEMLKKLSLRDLGFASHEGCPSRFCAERPGDHSAESTD
jgi:hypothetical protein